MEELKAMFRVCAHIKKDGVRCNSPAMKGMNFCYQHIGGNIRELTRARSTYIGPRLDFLYPGDRQSIQHNLSVIAQAVDDGKIDLQTANTYIRIYSACERNLRRWETLYQKDAPEKELAPLPADDNAGAPSFRAVDRGPHEQVFVRGVAVRERVGDEESGKQKSSDSDEPEIDWMKYNQRFLEIDRKYMNDPSYTDRLHTAIQEIKEEERALAAS